MVEKAFDKLVVLLAEDVDRNMLRCAELGLSHESSSSRRTWIEIRTRSRRRCRIRVVLLAEDVDRNIQGIFTGNWEQASSSSRRTWIEILPARASSSRARVVLLAEDVDRNNIRNGRRLNAAGRPPRGGRG